MKLKTLCAEEKDDVCVALTCAFVWNTVAFEVSWAHLTGSVWLRHTLLRTLPLLHLLLHPVFHPLPVFALLLVFMLFRLLPGLVVAGWRTLVPGDLRGHVSWRWCSNAGRGEHRWSWEKRRRLAEPLGHCGFLRVAVSPVVAGVIADIRQCFERARDVQHRERLGAGCRATFWHRNCHSSLCSTCLSSPIGGAELAIDRGCCSLAGKVWYSGLFVCKGVNEVSGRPFLAEK